MCVSSSDHNLVHGNGEFRVPRELFLHGLDNVVRHEGFAVVLANVAAGHKAGFAAQVARKLPAVVVLHDDGALRVFQDFENGFAMQRHEPADLQLIGGDALLIEEFTSLLDHSFRRTPANQGHIGIAWARERGRRNGGLNTCDLAHTLFHHGPALDWIGELVANYYAVFLVFICSHRVDVAGHAGNRARRNAAVRDFVALVAAVRGNRGVCAVAVGAGDELAAINRRTEIQIFRINAEPAFRQQQIAKHEPWTLEAVSNIKYLGNKLEAVSDVERSSDHPRIIAKGGAEHLPEVALLGFGGDTRRRAGSLAVDDHHRGFDHRGHAQSLAH